MRGRWLFFTLFAVMAMPGRFLSIFFAAHDLNDTQIGIILASANMVSLFSGPAMCNLADRLQKRELVTAFTYSIAISVFMLQALALPSLEIVGNEWRFLFMLTLQVVYGMFSAGAYPLVCAITISQLKTLYGEEGHERFGEERLWGAVSWAMSSFLLGVLLDIPKIGVWVIHIGVGVFGAIFVVTVLIYARVNKRIGVVDKEVGSGLMKENEVSEDGKEVTLSSTMEAIYRIFTEGGLSTPLFFNLIFWLSAGMSLVEGLLFLFFKNDLTSSNIICGISVIITVIFEIPLFAVAPELLQKVGAPALAIIGSMGYAIRGFGYTMVPNASMVLLFEPLHGITFATAHTASVAYVAERSEKKLEATAQSVLLALRALGSAVGTVVGGYIMEKLGSRVLYRGAAILVVLATLSFAIVEMWSSKTEKGLSHQKIRLRSDDEIEEEELISSEVMNS